MTTADAAVDMSLIGLFMQAHIVVKVVMVGLVFASIWCWAIVFEKVTQYGRVRKAAERFEGVFWSGTSLDELYRSLAGQQNIATAAVFVAAMREWKRSLEGGPRIGGLQLRLQKVMDVAISREMDKLERNLLTLATVGAISPFVGLFGTVWGIMTAFQGIAVSKNTSLAVVAPGIAEALFATALGLIAAIPAVIAYNKFNTDIARHQARLEGFADEFSAILSRQIDQRGAA